MPQDSPVRGAHKWGTPVPGQARCRVAVQGPGASREQGVASSAMSSPTPGGAPRRSWSKLKSNAVRQRAALSYASASTNDGADAKR